MSCQNAEIAATRFLEEAIKDPIVLNKVIDWSGTIENAKTISKTFKDKTGSVAISRLQQADAVYKNSQKNLQTFTLYASSKSAVYLDNVVELLNKSSIPERVNMLKFAQDFSISDISNSQLVMDMIDGDYTKLGEGFINKVKDGLSLQVVYDYAKKDLPDSTDLQKFLDTVNLDRSDFDRLREMVNTNPAQQIQDIDAMLKSMDESKDIYELEDSFTRGLDYFLKQDGQTRQVIVDAYKSRTIELINNIAGIKLAGSEHEAFMKVLSNVEKGMVFIASGITTDIEGAMKYVISAKYLNGLGYQLAGDPKDFANQARYFYNGLQDQYFFYLKLKNEGKTTKEIKEIFKDTYTDPKSYNKAGINKNLAVTRGGKSEFISSVEDFDKKKIDVRNMLGFSDNLLQNDPYMSTVLDFIVKRKGGGSNELAQKIQATKEKYLKGLSELNPTDKTDILRKVSDDMKVYLSDMSKAPVNDADPVTQVLNFVLGVGNPDKKKSIMLDTYTVSEGELGQLRGDLQDIGMYRVSLGKFMDTGYGMSDIEDAISELSKYSENQRVSANFKNPILAGIQNGDITSVFIPNVAKQNSLGLLNNYIEVSNRLGKKSVIVRYPSLGYQTYSLALENGELVVKSISPIDRNNLIDRIKLMTNDNEAYKDLKGNDVARDEYKAKLSDIRAIEGINSNDVDELFNKTYGNQTMAYIDQQMNIVNSVSGMKFQKRLVNIDDERNIIKKDPNFTETVKQEAQRIINEMGLGKVTDINGKAIINFRYFNVPTVRDNLIENILDMKYSRSIRDKFIARQKFLAEIGVLQNAIPYNILDGADKVDLYEATIQSLNKKGYRPSTFFATNEALDWFMNNSYKIRNEFDEALKKEMEGNEAVRNFMGGIIGKTIIDPDVDKVALYKEITNEIVSSLETEIGNGNIFKANKSLQIQGIGAIYQPLKDKAQNMTKEEFLDYFSSLQRQNEEFYYAEKVSGDEKKIFDDISKIEEDEQKLGTKKAKFKGTIKIESKAEKTAQEIDFLSRKERIKERMSEFYGIDDQNRIDSKYDEIINRSINIKSLKKPEIDIRKIDMSAEKLRDISNEIKASGVDESNILAYTDDTSELYNKTKAQLVEGGYIEDAGKILEKQPVDKYKNLVNKVLDEYSAIGDKLTKEYQSAKTLEEKAQAIRKSYDLKNLFKNKVEEIEHQIVTEYRDVIDRRSLISMKSDIMLVDVTAPANNVSEASKRIKQAWNSTLDIVQKDLNKAILNAGSSDISALNKSIIEDLYSKGYYVLPFNGQFTRITIDDVLINTAKKLPDGLSKDIDAIKSVDFTKLDQATKNTYLKILKSAEAYNDSGKNSLASIMRSDIDPALKNFDNESRLGIYTPQSNVLSKVKTYGKGFNLPQVLVKTSQNFLDMYSTAKGVVSEIIADTSDDMLKATDWDAYFKRKVFEDISSRIEKGTYSHKDFVKVFDSVFNNMKMQKTGFKDEVLGGISQDDPLLKKYYQELSDAMDNYSHLKSFELTDTSIKKLENRNLFTEQILQTITPEDRDLLNQIKIGDDTLNSAVVDTKKPIENQETVLENKAPEVVTEDIVQKENDMIPDTVEKKLYDKQRTNEYELETTMNDYTKQFNQRSLWNLGLSSVNDLMKKTPQANQMRFILNEFKNTGRLAQEALDAVASLGQKKTEEFIDILKQSYSDGKFSGIAKPSDANDAMGNYTYIVSDYFNRLSEKLSSIEGLDDDLLKGFQNIHRTVLNIKGIDDIKSIKKAEVISDTRILAMAKNGNKDLSTSGKLFDNKMGTISSETKEFFRKYFGNNLSDGEIRILYDNLAGSNYTSGRFKRYLSNIAGAFRVMAGVSLGAVISGTLQGTSRIATASADWIKKTYDNTLELAPEISQKLDRGMGEGFSLSMGKGLLSLGRNDTIEESLRKGVAWDLLKQESMGGINQVADIIARDRVKAVSLYEAIRSERGMNMREFNKWLDEMPEGTTKNEIISRVKLKASELYVNSEAIAGGILNKGAQRNRATYYTGTMDFKGSRGQGMIKNMFNNILGPIGFTRNIMIQELSKGKGFIEASTTAAKRLANNHEFKTMINTIMNQMRLASKLRHMKRKDENKDDSRDASDEMKVLLNTGALASQYLSAFDSTSLGRTIQRMRDSYGFGGKAYEGDSSVGLEAYKNFSSFVAEFGKQYKGILNRMPDLLVGISEGNTADALANFFGDASLGFQRYVVGEVESPTGMEYLPKSYGINLGIFGKEPIMDDLRNQRSKGIYSMKFDPESMNKPGIRDNLKSEVIGKLPLFKQLMYNVDRANAKIKGSEAKDIQTYIDYMDQNPVANKFFKAGLFDFNSAVKDLGPNSKDFVDLVWSQLTFQSEDAQKMLGAGNLNTWITELEKQGPNKNIFVESFLKGLNGDEQAKLKVQLELAKGATGKKLVESLQVLNGLVKSKKEGVDPEGIGLHRMLLGYVADAYVDMRTKQAKEVVKKAGLSKATINIGGEFINVDVKSDLIGGLEDKFRMEFLSSAGQIIPTVDAQFGVDVLADYNYYNPATPESVKAFYGAGKPYKDFKTGIEKANFYLPDKRQQALLAEYFTQRAASEGDVNAYVRKNAFANMTYGMTAGQKVATFNDTMKVLENRGINRDIIASMGSGILDYNPDMMDAYYDLKRLQPELANDFKNRIYGTNNDLIDLAAAISGGADSDKGKTGNSTSRSANYKLEDAKRAGSFMSKTKANSDYFTGTKTTKNEGITNIADNYIPKSRRDFITGSGKQLDNFKGSKGTTAASKVYTGTTKTVGRSAASNITKPKLTTYKPKKGSQKGATKTKLNRS